MPIPTWISIQIASTSILTVMASRTSVKPGPPMPTGTVCSIRPTTTTTTACSTKSTSMMVALCPPYRTPTGAETQTFKIWTQTTTASTTPSRATTMTSMASPISRQTETTGMAMASTTLLIPMRAPHPRQRLTATTMTHRTIRIRTMTATGSSPPTRMSTTTAPRVMTTATTTTSPTTSIPTTMATASPPRTKNQILTGTETPMTQRRRYRARCLTT